MKLAGGLLAFVIALGVIGLYGAAGLFDVEPHEDFDERWHGNESFAWTWDSVTALTARFDGGPDTDEDYENDWPSATTI